MTGWSPVTRRRAAWRVIYPPQAAYYDYALALVFGAGIYRTGGEMSSNLSDMDGYSYTRAGKKGEHR